MFLVVHHGEIMIWVFLPMPMKLQEKLAYSAMSVPVVRHGVTTGALSAISVFSHNSYRILPDMLKHSSLEETLTPVQPTQMGTLIGLAVTHMEPPFRMSPSP